MYYTELSAQRQSSINTEKRDTWHRTRRSGKWLMQKAQFDMTGDGFFSLQGCYIIIKQASDSS